MIPTFCASAVPARVWCLAKVKNGRFIGVEGMKECPTTTVKNARRARRSAVGYPRNVLRYPIKRVGEKRRGHVRAHHF